MAPPPDSANAEALAEAMALESAGDADAALRIYLALAARDPQNVDAAYRAGTALMRRGELDDAVTMLRRVVFNQPDHGPARANLGNALLLLGRDEPAREAFVAVLERSPDNRNALYGLATILIRLGRHQEAQRYSSRLLAALPDSAAALPWMPTRVAPRAAPRRWHSTGRHCGSTPTMCRRCADWRNSCSTRAAMPMRKRSCAERWPMCPMTPNSSPCSARSCLRPTIGAGPSMPSHRRGATIPTPPITRST